MIWTRGSRQRHRGCAAINIYVYRVYKLKKKKKREFRNSICHRHAAAVANRTNADRTQHVSFSNIPFIDTIYLREIGCCWPAPSNVHTLWPGESAVHSILAQHIRSDQTQSPVSPPPTYIYIIIARKSWITVCVCVLCYRIRLVWSRPKNWWASTRVWISFRNVISIGRG